MFRAGYAALVGVPNVGKSTLLNAFVGAPVAITSPKPQTTRSNITGIKTTEEYQIVFVDTPGFHISSGKLNRAMVHAALTAVTDVNVILLLTNPLKGKNGEFEELLNKVKQSGLPAILVLTKADQHPKEALYKTAEALSRLHDFRHVIPVSAKTGAGVAELARLTAAELPSGEPLYSAEELTTQSLSFLAAEYVREELFRLLNQELPYNVTVETEELKEEEKLVSVRAVIVVARESHKPIVIGKGGAMLKEVGTRARKKLAAFLGVKVRLDLHVSVRENWQEKWAG